MGKTTNRRNRRWAALAVITVGTAALPGCLQTVLSTIGASFF